MSSWGQCGVAGPGKLMPMGGDKQRDGVSSMEGSKFGKFENPAGLQELYDSELNLDLLLQTLFP